MSTNARTIDTTYIKFDVIDYSNTNTLSTYALKQTPLTFAPDFTTSPLLTSSRTISNKILKWDFGDGTYSNDLTATHAYVWPGNYQVKLTVFNQEGFPVESTYKPAIQVINFVPDTLKWGNYGKFVYDVPAGKLGDPLTIITRNSWQSYNALSATGITINLYASGAAGDYIDEANFYNDKWSHLRLLSRFYEKQKYGNVEQLVIVDTITANAVEIYAQIKNNQIQICSANDEGSFFVGTTATNSIYYVDDKVKNYTSRENPIFLLASFDTSKFEDAFSQQREIYNYINYPPYGFQSLPVAVLPVIKVRHNPADHLSITTTGIDGEGTLSSTVFEIPNISWQCTEIPFVVRFKDNENFTTKTYQPLSSSTVHSYLTTLTSYDLQLGIIYDNNGVQTPLENVTFYEDFSPEIPQSYGGFYKGYFIANESALNCTLTAQVVVSDPINFPKDSLVGWIAVPQYGYMLRIFREQHFNGCLGSVSVELTGNQAYVNSRANRNVYAICVAPSGAGVGNDYQAWFADNVTDTILKYDVYGQLLSSIPLSSAPVQINSVVTNTDLRSTELSSAAPSNIALDSNSDLWVTLFDTGNVIKINGVNGYVTAIAKPPGDNIYYILSSYGIAPELSGFAGEGLYLPSSVDTDADNNIWVAYTHPVSNFIVKYDTNGTLLTTIPFPPVVSPVEIKIDRNKKVWVTTSNHDNEFVTLTGRNDLLYKFDSDGTLLSGFPLSGFRMLNNITVDGLQNAWVSHDRETLTKIDAITNAVTNYIAGSGINQTNYICSIAGLTCDTANYIWAINNYDKQIYIFDANAEPTPYFNPIDSVQLALPVVQPQYPLSAYELNQFQAYGDWFGYNWINKYMIPATVIRTVTGASNTFNIYTTGGEYNISKINENFDASDYYKSLRYQEILLDKDKFFNSFLGGIVGDATAQPYELGKTVYEKIANFVDNRSNITTCNIDALIALCNELSIEFEEYNYPFPPQMRRMMDILSINQKKLWGDQNTYSENFDNRGYIANGEYGTNLGSEISPVTGIIYSGIPIVANELFSGLYSKINFNVIPGTVYSQEIPLSSHSYNWGWGLVSPKSLTGTRISDYYKFYTTVDTATGDIFNNIIDWYNPLTTLSHYTSTFMTWSEDNGIVQNMISYELTKGMRLFTSAADITYNN